MPGGRPGALAAACSESSGPAAHAHRGGAALDGCMRAGGTTSIVRVRGDGDRFPAAVIGHGPTGWAARRR
jgi:hypothetical protein